MAYLASSGLCIGAIGCLSSQKTARLGNTLGLLGVGGGVAACLGAMGGDPALLAQTLGAPMWLHHTCVTVTRPLRTFGSYIWSG